MIRRHLLALALLGLVTAAGCSDDSCGPGSAPADGLTVTPAGGAALTFGQIHSSPNNDCTPPGGTGPTSLTVEAAQTQPAASNRFFVLCLPRPDQIGSDPIALDDDSLVQVIDLLGQGDDGCRIDLDRTRPFSAGQVSFSGFCGDGTGASGYALSLSGTLPATRTCPSADAGPEPITLSLSGTAAVTADQP